MAGKPSKLLTSFVKDDALVQDANYRFDADERQTLDNQMQAVQTIVGATIGATSASSFPVPPSGHAALIVDPGASCTPLIKFADGTTRDLQFSLTADLKSPRYGAKGDGVTDDSAAIQSAITAGAKDLFFPAGTYRLATNFTFPSTVRLEFATGAKIAPDAAATITIDSPIVAAASQQIFGGSGKIAMRQGGVSIKPGWYGCPCNGVDDDYTGFRALLDSLPAVASTGGQVSYTVELPVANMWMSQDLHIDRLVRIIGSGQAGGDHNPGTVISFAPGHGIIFEDTKTSSDTSTSSGSHFEQVTLQSKQLAVGNPIYGAMYFGRAASTKYALNDCVIHTQVSPTRAGCAGADGRLIFFRCTTAGTTAATPLSGDPTGFSSAIIGSAITDGTVVWTAESLPYDYPAGVATAIVAGQRVFVVGETRYYWEAQNSGTTAGGSPGPLATEVTPGEVIADGTVNWITKVPAAILTRTGDLKIRHCYANGFTGYALHVQGDSAASPNNIADFGEIEEFHFQGCGGGVHFKGFDAQGWVVVSSEGTLNVDVASGMRTLKDATVGYGCHGFYDRSLGNTYLGCYYQGGGGIGFYNPANNGSTYIGCRSESSYKNVVYAGNVFISGNDQIGTTGGCTYITSSAVQNVVANIPAGTKTIFGYLDQQYASSMSRAFSLQSSDDAGNALGWGYEAAGTTFSNVGNAGTGWFSLAWGPSGIITNCVGVSGAASSEGPGLWRHYIGWFEGTDAHGTRFRGVDATALTANELRGGQQIVGDKFRVQGSVAGTWDGYVVTAAGYRGPHWVQNSAQSTGYAPWGLSASMVEPTANAAPIPAAGSKVFRCVAATGDQTTGSVEPNWATATIVGNQIVDHNVTWQLVGFTPTYSRFEWIDDPVYAITPQSRKHWRDTAATDSATSAPKSKRDEYRKSIQTTTNGAGQTLLTTDDLADNSTSVIDVVVCGKQNGVFSEFASAKLSGTYGRNNGGAPTLAGSVDNTVKGTASLGTSSFSLAVSGNGIAIEVTPGVNAAVDWGLIVTVTEGKS